MKRDSVEIENKAPDSHVASTDQDRFGKIVAHPRIPFGHHLSRKFRVSMK